MPKYKLRLIAVGDFLYDDGGSADWVRAETADQARDYFEKQKGERPQYVHSTIAVGHILYQRDIDSGDAHEDAEAGDTSYEWRNDDGRDLAANEIRVWEIGAPRVHWQMMPIREPAEPETIPVGTSVFHPRGRLGHGRTASRAYVIGRWWWIDVDWGWPQPQFWRACKLSTIGLLPSMGWPKTRYRLTVAGEHVADGTEEALQTLRDARISRLNAEWEAGQGREAVHA